MNVLIFQLDGKIPNIAVMRIAEHHRQRGDSVAFRWTGSPERELWDEMPDVVYGSAIFEKTRPAVARLLKEYPRAIVGGTGVDVASSLEAQGITTTRQDYSLYPAWRQSIGFTQRGCRLKCSFCVVPRKDGKVRFENKIMEIWRGEPWPRELILLDNDFFGQLDWQLRIQEIREGGFKVSFTQGINARLIDDEQAAAIASIDYRDDSMKVKRIYTAWDNSKDVAALFRGLDRLRAAGVKPDHIMVYMLIGFDHATKKPIEHVTKDDRTRAYLLRRFGARPYPMPFVRTPELIGFQRWIVGAYDKRFSWEEWSAAGYRPEGLATADHCGEHEEALIE